MDCVVKTSRNHRLCPSQHGLDALEIQTHQKVRRIDHLCRIANRAHRSLIIEIGRQPGGALSSGRKSTIQWRISFMSLALSSTSRTGGELGIPQQRTADASPIPAPVVLWSLPGSSLLFAGA